MLCIAYGRVSAKCKVINITQSNYFNVFYSIVILLNISTYNHVTRNHLYREEAIKKTITKFMKYQVYHIIYIIFYYILTLYFYYRI